MRILSLISIISFFSLQIFAEDFSKINKNELIRLDNDSLTDFFINKKVSGIYNTQKKFIIVYYPDGEYYLTDEYKDRFGSWEIRENKVCFLDTDKCLAYYKKEEDGTTYYYAEDATDFIAKITEVSKVLNIRDEELLHPEQIPYSVKIVENDLIIEGSIEWDLMDLVKSTLKENLNVTRVVLSSKGGDEEAAFKISDIIIDYDLNTHAKNCMSSCTIVFLAGNKRTLEKGFKIGFHQTSWSANSIESYYEIVKEDYEDIFEFIEWVYDDTQETLFKKMLFFLERGVSSSFAIKTLQKKSASMWYPRRKELINANFITE